ncbi:hypothetical protein ACLQ3B_12225 [Micromonospora sp. DT53]
MIDLSDWSPEGSPVLDSSLVATGVGALPGGAGSWFDNAAWCLA